MALLLVAVAVLCGCQDGRQLTWAPPALDDPIRIEVPPEGGQWDPPRDRDCLVVMPDVPVTDTVRVLGCHDLVLIGGQTKIGGAPDGNPPKPGLYLVDYTGTLHVEGWRAGGSGLTDGIWASTRFRGTTAQIQNVYVTGLHAMKEYRLGRFAPGWPEPDEHPDVVQLWQGPTRVPCRPLLGRSPYQGLLSRLHRVSPARLRVEPREDDRPQAHLRRPDPHGAFVLRLLPAAWGAEGAAQERLLRVRAGGVGWWPSPPAETTRRDGGAACGEGGPPSASSSDRPAWATSLPGTARAAGAQPADESLLVPLPRRLGGRRRGPRTPASRAPRAWRRSPGTGGRSPRAACPRPGCRARCPSPDTAISRRVTSITGHRLAAAGVPGAPVELGPAQRLRHGQVGLHGVLHVEVVALGAAVGADHRASRP